MKYDVLTLDTQVFTTNNFDFDGGWLAQVKQFKDGPIDVVISSVVAREARNQLSEKIRKTKDRFESVVKDAAHYGLDAAAAVGLPSWPRRQTPWPPRGSRPVSTQSARPRPCPSALSRWRL